MKHLDAAEFYAEGRRHLIGVISFNRALLSFQNGETGAGVDAMEKALSLSRLEILRYCRFSGIVREMAARIPELKAFLLSTTGREPGRSAANPKTG